MLERLGDSPGRLVAVHMPAEGSGQKLGPGKRHLVSKHTLFAGRVKLRRHLLAEGGIVLYVAAC